MISQYFCIYFLGYQSYTYSKITTRTREISPPPVQEPPLEKAIAPPKDNSEYHMNILFYYLFSISSDWKS